MRTTYGDIPNQSVDVYLDGLVNKVYKILPLKESKSETVKLYISSLLREIIGNQKLVDRFKDDELLLSLIGTLESIKDEEHHSNYKSDVFKCIGVIKKLHLLVGDS